ncbi:polysaccharide lyase family 14 protein [Heterobasidion irregulare TC 32-1]|uniref:Polysaccharide lyase family 14 protein n=1 Tax=Heterobasidion irregulare (strain TC 32-1) TaxID=747525 RepID=W4JNZ3_HETIT|nr:polysaccharide lyase family 14 protein [Heterobasidion irregulare TC 32-1]ETW74606.1 polysaccharide lyase family 14 protein [Heterobasidion irregulare TC 32-1]
MSCSQLLPLPSASIHNAFTTSNLLSRTSFPHGISLTPLTDAALGVHKLSHPHILTHRVVCPPVPHTAVAIATASASSVQDANEKEAWEAIYIKGSINPAGAVKGGFGFYLGGPEDFQARLMHEGAEEVLMAYEVMFEKDWEWAKGGKLPGIYGGIGDAAYGCSGGRKDARCKCFDLRLMWRANGAGELYAYLPLTPTNAERLLRVPPTSHENTDYGFSVGRGAWRFQSGRWHCVAIRVKMNHVGRENGEVEVYIDGTSVLRATSLVLREDPASRIRGMHFQTFFGGNKPDWASPKHQRAWFASITGAIVQPEPEVHHTRQNDKL